MSVARCQVCDQELSRSYSTRVAHAQLDEFQATPDGTGWAFIVAAVSACSWSHLAVLCARLAAREPDCDAAVLIVAERDRQANTEGFAPEHDLDHPEGELAQAGVTYAVPHITPTWTPPDGVSAGEMWPWFDTEYNPKDKRRDLIRAGALLAAELDRDRAVTPATYQNSDPF